MSSLSARIERLPFTRFHWHLLMMGGLGYSFDGLDAAVVAFVLPVLRPAWGLTSIQVGFLGSATFIGFFFGALLAGLIGESKTGPGATATCSAPSPPGRRPWLCRKPPSSAGWACCGRRGCAGSRRWPG